MGDSNTVGIGNPDRSGNVNTSYGYRLRLQNHLINVGFNADFVGTQRSACTYVKDCEHDGYSGKGIATLQKLVNSGAIEKLKADYALMLIGSNDMWISLKDRRPISDATANLRCKDYDKLVASMLKHKPSLKIVLAKPATPRNAARPLGIFRKCIQNVSVKYKTKLVDLGAVPNDGTHYTPAGHNKIADIWLGQIK